MKDKKDIVYCTATSGIPRFRKKLANTGYKNIYTLYLVYYHEYTKKMETIKLNYGDYKTAASKSDMEFNIAPGWGGVSLCESSIVVSTYWGKQKLHEETLFNRVAENYN